MFLHSWNGTAYAPLLSFNYTSVSTLDGRTQAAGTIVSSPKNSFIAVTTFTNTIYGGLDNSTGIV